MATRWMVAGWIGLVLAEALMADPHQHASYVLAEERLAARIWLEAAHLFEDYLAEVPEDHTTRMKVATVYYQLGFLPEASRHAASVYLESRQHPESRRLLVRIRSRMARELDDTDPDAVLEFARLAGLLGNVDRAAAYYDRAWELKPSPEVLLERARLYNWSGRGMAAVPVYREYARWRPNDLAARHEYARLLNAVGEHEQAAGELRALLQLRPRDVEMEMDLARALLWSDALEEAERILRNLLRRQPGHVGALEMLASVYHARRQHLAAYEAYRDVLRFQPDHREALWWTGEYERRRYLDMALLREKLTVQPEDRDSRIALTEILLAERRWSEALLEMDIHLALFPDDREVKDRRSAVEQEERARLAVEAQRVHARVMSRWEAPIRVGRRWVEYHPEDIISLRRYALALLMDRRVSEADQALINWPAHSEIDLSIQQLRERRAQAERKGP